MYETQTRNTLRAIIAAAIVDWSIDVSWAAPKTNDREELIEHIDDMCNEHGLVPGADGYLVRL